VYFTAFCLGGPFFPGHGVYRNAFASDPVRTALNNVSFVKILSCQTLFCHLNSASHNTQNTTDRHFAIDLCRTMPLQALYLQFWCSPFAWLLFTLRGVFKKFL